MADYTALTGEVSVKGAEIIRRRSQQGDLPAEQAGMVNHEQRLAKAHWPVVNMLDPDAIVLAAGWVTSIACIRRYRR